MPFVFCRRPWRGMYGVFGRNMTETQCNAAARCVLFWPLAALLTLVPPASTLAAPVRRGRRTRVCGWARGGGRALIGGRASWLRRVGHGWLRSATTVFFVHDYDIIIRQERLSVLPSYVLHTYMYLYLRSRYARYDAIACFCLKKMEERNRDNLNLESKRVGVRE